MREIAVLFKAIDNMTAPAKAMTLSLMGTKKTVNEFQDDLKKLSTQKVSLQINNQKARDELRSTKKDAKDLGVSFDELYTERSNKQMAIQLDLETTNKEIAIAKKGIDELNSAVSKMDNNASSRGGNSGGLGTMMNAGMGAFVGQQVSGMLSNITNNVLPNSINSALTGAITGGATGFAVGGPVGAGVGAVIGGATSYIGAEVQKQTDKAKQRVQIGSDMLVQGAGKLLSDSMSYANNMENTRISMDTLVGEERAGEFMCRQKHLKLHTVGRLKQ